MSYLKYFRFANDCAPLRLMGMFFAADKYFAEADLN